VPLPQLTGNVVELVEVLVLLLVVDDGVVVVGPMLVEVVVLAGALDVLLLVDVEVLEVIGGAVLLVVVEDVLEDVLDVVLDDGRVVVVENVLDVVVTGAVLVLVVDEVLDVVLEDGRDVDVEDVLDDVVTGAALVLVVDDVLDVVLDGGCDVVVEDVLDVVVTGAALVLVVGEAVVDVDEVVATMLLVVVPGVLDPQRNAKWRPVLIVLAQALPVSSAVEPIESLASGLRITASIRLCAGSFTRVPPTSTIGSGVPVSGGSAKIVASPSTRSPATAMDVGAPGESETNTSRPVRMLQNV
jgi:hypothetical protein